ncbi:hypothetical protein ACRAWF_14460 [Streptomyces sp. L7]
MACSARDARVQAPAGQQVRRHGTGDVRDAAGTAVLSPRRSRSPRRSSPRPTGRRTGELDDPPAPARGAQRRRVRRRMRSSATASSGVPGWGAWLTVVVVVRGVGVIVIVGVRVRVGMGVVVPRRWGCGFGRSGCGSISASGSISGLGRGFWGRWWPRPGLRSSAPASELALTSPEFGLGVRTGSRCPRSRPRSFGTGLGCLGVGLVLKAGPGLGVGLVLRLHAFPLAFPLSAATGVSPGSPSVGLLSCSRGAMPFLHRLGWFNCRIAVGVVTQGWRGRRTVGEEAVRAAPVGGV